MEKVVSPKKLIEVALPLDDINAASGREKYQSNGHPCTLHLWWARRPLAAARAVLFAQLVNDPGGERGYKRGLTKAQAAEKREKLFSIIRDLVKWENLTNDEVLERARRAIRESWVETCAMNKGKPGFDPEKLPAFHDPFAGGGAIPLSAQHLGLESYASDLNPVAVMINKAMLEIPPRFRDSQPVGPLPPSEELIPNAYSGTQGLAEDVRRYGRWMRDEAQKRIGSYYPKVEITPDMAVNRSDLAPYVGQKLTVIAWIWARTVKSPNPAFSHIDVPLVSSFILSKKKGREVYVEPIVSDNDYRFEVKLGTPPPSAALGTKMGKKKNFRCVMSNAPIDYDYIKEQGKQHRLGSRLMTIVLEGKGCRLYTPPPQNHEAIARDVPSSWSPTTQIPSKALGIRPPLYGFITFGEIYTQRQLLVLNTFCDLVQEVKVSAMRDALAVGMHDDGVALADGGCGANAYGEAIAVYLAFACSRAADRGSSVCTWFTGGESLRNTFGRPALQMTWDYAEGNPFSDSAGNFLHGMELVAECIQSLEYRGFGVAEQADAQCQKISQGKVLSTDPPYYDNIEYSALSDYFYVWLRKNLKDIYPNLFATISVPKAGELVASPGCHGSKEAAEAFFMDGMTTAMKNLANSAHPAFPVTIYYAFKASETMDGSTSNTGWEAFLEAVIRAGFAITGTWPMRTEHASRMVGMGKNALASSIVLVCRKRPEDAEFIRRRQFISELVQRMPEALDDMTGTGSERRAVAPVDLAQAAIGPGMEIFSKYKGVLRADGTPMTVHDAIIEINRQISDYLNPDGSNFDEGTLFCDEWYRQYGWGSGAFGEADVLARGKGTTVDSLAAAGVITAHGGKVQLIHWQDYPDNYEPEGDDKRPVWEACHHLIRAMRNGGEQAAGKLLARMPEVTGDVRRLAYHLYTYNERGGDAEEARAYNELISSWEEILKAAVPEDETKQGNLYI